MFLRWHFLSDVKSVESVIQHGSNIFLKKCVEAYLEGGLTLHIADYCRSQVVKILAWTR